MAKPWEKYQASAKPWEKYQPDSNGAQEPKKKPGFFEDLKKFAKNDPVLGAIENMIGFGTALVAEPISGYAGMVGEPGSVEATQKSLTYKPRSEEAQAQAKGIGELFAPVGQAIGAAEEFLGEAAFEATGSPVAAAAAATIPTAAMELLGLKGAGRARQAVPEAITPEQAPTLPETGIRATAGEVAQDLPQQKAEQFLLEQTGEGGEQLRGYKLAQSREIRDYLEGVNPDQVDNVGESIKQALELRESSVAYKRKQAYETLGELTKDLDVRLNTDVVGEALPEARELRGFERTMPNQFKAIDGLLNEFGFDLTPEGMKKAVDGGYDIDPLSVSNMEEFRKALISIEKADQTGLTSTITGPIKEALDREFDLASLALQESGSPDVARAAKNARQSHIALKTEFDDKGLVKQLIDTKGYQSKLPKVEESQVYNKLIAKSTSIEQFNRVVKSLDRAASKGKRAKSQIKAQMMLDLIDSGFSAKSRKIDGEQVFGANAFSRRFDEMEPKLKAIMSDSEFKKLEKFRKDANDLIPPSGALPKGSAGFFIEALDKAGLFGMMSAIPYAGAATAGFLKNIGRKSQDLNAFDRAIKSKPEVKDAVNLISTDYPSLGVALGIPQLLEDEQ